MKCKVELSNPMALVPGPGTYSPDLNKKKGYKFS